MRVVLAEDLYLLRDGLSRLLEAHGFEITAAVESGPALARALTELRPDVAVVDVRLPPTFTDEGLQATLAARRSSARAPSASTPRASSPSSTWPPPTTTTGGCWPCWPTSTAPGPSSSARTAPARPPLSRAPLLFPLGALLRSVA